MMALNYWPLSPGQGKGWGKDHASLLPGVDVYTLADNMEVKPYLIHPNLYISPKAAPNPPKFPRWSYLWTQYGEGARTGMETTSTNATQGHQKLSNPQLNLNAMQPQM